MSWTCLTNFSAEDASFSWGQITLLVIGRYFSHVQVVFNYSDAYAMILHVNRIWKKEGWFSYCISILISWLLCSPLLTHSLVTDVMSRSICHESVIKFLLDALVLVDACILVEYYVFQLNLCCFVIRDQFGVYSVCGCLSACSEGSGITRWRIHFHQSFFPAFGVNVQCPCCTVLQYVPNEPVNISFNLRFLGNLGGNNTFFVVSY